MFFFVGWWVSDFHQNGNVTEIVDPWPSFNTHFNSFASSNFMANSRITNFVVTDMATYPSVCNHFWIVMGHADFFGIAPFYNGSILACLTCLADWYLWETERDICLRAFRVFFVRIVLEAAQLPSRTLTVLGRLTTTSMFPVFACILFIAIRISFACWRSP